MLLDQLERDAERHDAGHVLGAGPALPFLAAAVNQGDQGRVAPDIEHAHALGRIDLVAGQREQVDPEPVDVQVEKARGLNGVRVDRDTPRAARARDLGHRLDGADLVIGEHDADEARVGPEGRDQGRRIDDAVLGHRHVCHLDAPVLLEGAGGAQHRAVLDRRRDEMPSSRHGQRHALQRQVVALGPPAREDDLVLAATQDPGHLGPRPLERVAGAPAEGIQIRGIAELPAQVGLRGLEDTRMHRSRRRVVEVDRAMGRCHGGLLSRCRSPG